MSIQISTYLSKIHPFLINNNLITQAEITDKCYQIKMDIDLSLTEQLLFYLVENFCENMGLEYSVPVINKESITFNNTLDDLFEDETINWATITKEEMLEKIQV